MAQHHMDYRGKPLQIISIYLIVIAFSLRIWEFEALRIRSVTYDSRDQTLNSVYEISRVGRSPKLRREGNTHPTLTYIKVIRINISFTSITPIWCLITKYNAVLKLQKSTLTIDVSYCFGMSSPTIVGYDPFSTAPPPPPPLPPPMTHPPTPGQILSHIYVKINLLDKEITLLKTNRY